MQQSMSSFCCVTAAGCCRTLQRSCRLWLCASTWGLQQPKGKGLHACGEFSCVVSGPRGMLVRVCVVCCRQSFRAHACMVTACMHAHSHSAAVASDASARLLPRCCGGPAAVGASVFVLGVSCCLCLLGIMLCTPLVIAGSGQLPVCLPVSVQMLPGLFWGAVCKPTKRCAPPCEQLCLPACKHARTAWPCLQGYRAVH